MTKILESSYRNYTFKISFESDIEAYVLKFYKDGQHLKNADYYTDDKQDAIQTMQAGRNRVSNFS